MGLCISIFHGLPQTANRYQLPIADKQEEGLKTKILAGHHMLIVPLPKCPIHLKDTQWAHSMAFPSFSKLMQITWKPRAESIEGVAFCFGAFNVTLSLFQSNHIFIGYPTVLLCSIYLLSA